MSDADATIPPADHALVEALPFFAPVFLIALVVGIVVLRDRWAGRRG